MDGDNKQGRLGFVALFIIAMCVGVILHNMSQHKQLRPYFYATPEKDQKESPKDLNTPPLLNPSSKQNRQEALKNLPKKNSPQSPQKKPSAPQKQSDESDEAPPQNETQPMLQKNFKKESKLAKKTQFLKARPGPKELSFTKEDFGESKKTTEDGVEFFETKFDVDYWAQKNTASDSQKIINANMKRVIEAQNKMKNYDAKISLYEYTFKHNKTERFGLKFQLPEANRPFQVKLQMRESPNFGAKNNIPEPVLPKVKRPTKTFQVERSKTSESPWNNFERPEQNY